jgi:hypothetical protein
VAVVDHRLRHAEGTPRSLKVPKACPGDREEREPRFLPDSSAPRREGSWARSASACSERWVSREDVGRAPTGGPSPGVSCRARCSRCRASARSCSCSWRWAPSSAPGHRGGPKGPQPTRCGWRRNSYSSPTSGNRGPVLLGRWKSGNRAPLSSHRCCGSCLHAHRIAPP